MKKDHIFTLIIALFICGVAFFLISFLFRKEKTISTTPSFYQHQTQIRGEEKKYKEISEENVKEEILKNIFGITPPESEKKKFRVLGLMDEKESGFLDNILIFPQPVFPRETLNLSVLTKGIEKVQGKIICIPNISLEIEFTPSRIIFVNQNPRNLWIGYLGEFEIPISLKIENCEIQLQAVDEKDNIIEELKVPLMWQF
jgi:hypothetical protein